MTHRRLSPAALAAAQPLWRRLLPAALAAALLLAAVSAGCSAREEVPPDQQVARRLWVAPSGSDKAPGSRDRPLRTLPRAAELLRPGDTLVLAPGTYPDALVLSIAATAEKPVRVRSAPDGRAVVPAIVLSGAHIRISGLDVRATRPPAKYHGLVDFLGARTCSVTDLSVEGGSAIAFGDKTAGCSAVRVTGEGGGAPFFSAGSSDNVVEDSRFEVDGESYFKGRDNRLERTVVTGSRNGRDCYQLASNDDTSPACVGGIIRGCTFSGFNRAPGAPSHTDIFQWFGADVRDLLIEGNTFGSAYIAPGNGGQDPQNAVFQISAEQTTTGPITIQNNLVLGGHFLLSVNAATPQVRPVDGIRIVNNFVRASSTVSTRGRVYDLANGWVIQNNIFDGVRSPDGRCSAQRIQGHNLFLGVRVPEWEAASSRSVGLPAERLFRDVGFAEAASWGLKGDYRPASDIVRMGVANAYTPARDIAGRTRRAPISVGPNEYVP